MQATMPSPLGPLLLTEEKGALCALDFAQSADLAPEGPLLTEAIRQLNEYFAGKRQNFTLPLAPQGTAFQRAVWQALTEIPFGQTRSYAEIARRIGKPGACRAVGAANGRNPLPILIPCHRVIGADGRLAGYSGGLEKKEFLLAVEGIRIKR